MSIAVEIVRIAEGIGIDNPDDKTLAAEGVGMVRKAHCAPAGHVGE